MSTQALTGRMAGSWLRSRPYLLSFLLLGVCLLLVGWLQPRYFRPANLVNNLRTFLPLMFLAAAQTLVVIAGGIDLSLGALLTLCSVVMVQTFGAAPTTGVTLGAVALGWGVGVGCGTFNGVCVAYLRLQPIVATFATSFLWGGIALWVLPQPGGTAPAALTEGVRASFGLPFALWVVVAMLLAWAWFGGTRLARFFYAVGGSPPAAFASGVPVARVRLISYVLAGGLAGLAAVLLVADLGSGDPLIGGPFTLFSVVAVVLGGTRLSGGQGSVVGSLIGVVVLSLFRNLVFNLGLPYLWQPFADGLIILLAVAGPGLSALRRATRRHSP